MRRLSVVTPAVLARLADHRALGSAPAEELAWLAEHGEVRQYAKGEMVAQKGESVTALYIVFTGHVVLRVDRGTGSHKLYEFRGGDVSGLLPYSRGAAAPNHMIAEEAVEWLAIDRDWFPELTRECPVVTGTLVHAMLDRARQFTANDLRDEKLLSLGRLASGLAHELNNPASSAVRGAKSLSASQAGADAAARRLGALRLPEAQLAALDAALSESRAVAKSAANGAASAPDGENGAGAEDVRSALDRADREDEMSAWLAANGGNDKCTIPLADSAISIRALDELAAVLKGDALDAALCWVAAACEMRRLAAEIENAASRIYQIVDAMKGFTFMDHVPTAEPVDIRRGITETLTMLSAKAREKGAKVSVQFAEDLPSAHAIGAELNQIWLNIIDNALDAIPTGGEVTVTVHEDLGRIVVAVRDSGHGIPPAVKDRIFDPFFTTKDVGKGSGLGLDIVRRLVKRNEGGIELDSKAGRTEFRVLIPTEAAALEARRLAERRSRETREMHPL